MNTSQAGPYFCIFIVDSLYYIPQFLPVAKELRKRNMSFLFLIMDKDTQEQNSIAVNFLHSQGLEYLNYKERHGNANLACKFLISGANVFPKLEIPYKYSCLIVHGIGTKAGYYTPEQNKHDIRFVEGQSRIDKIKELYPDVKTRLFNVGFAKLDGVFDFTDTDKKDLLEKMKLNINRKTILYSPTFYPSSVDKMPSDFPEDFKNYNIIIKPHLFSFRFKKYRHHIRKFNLWRQYPNVYFAGMDEFNLVPFLAVADIMISDESSAIFEFAALNKPVICNRNVKFRWSYRLFKFKIRKRMDKQMDIYRDVATSVLNYPDLVKAVEYELENPKLKEEQRLAICSQIVGTVDGKVSQRIADILENID